MLWVDKKASVTLAFPDDCPVEELRGESVTVRGKITEGEYKEYVGRMVRGMGTDEAGEQEMRIAVARNSTQRMALWITGTSFTGPRGNPCPKSRKMRELWFADLDPHAAREVLALIDAHIDAVMAGLGGDEPQDEATEG